MCCFLMLSSAHQVSCITLIFDPYYVTAEPAELLFTQILYRGFVFTVCPKINKLPGVCTRALLSARARPGP